MSRAALTLVEVLVAVAIALVLGSVLLGATRTTARTGAHVAGRADAHGTAALATALLRLELERAGRGMDDGGAAVVLDGAGAGGDRFHVRSLAQRYRADPVLIDAAFFAARDGAGRWNLYRDPAEGVRQPWLLGVRELRLVAARDRQGGRVERERLAGAEGLVGLEVEVRMTDGAHERFFAQSGHAEPRVAWDDP